MAEISKIPVSDFDAAVRLLSGGTNVAIYNDLGMPSIYVRRDKGLISDVIDGGPEMTHYAFKVNGVEVPAFYMGKYLATVYKGRALSLPLQDPAAYSVEAANRGNAPSSYVNFDNAKLWCEANGAGFHLPTIAEYAWIALLCRKNGTQPNGNNKKGSADGCLYEKGIASYFPSYSSTEINRTLTGSGPAKWNDNWKPDGICDLNGNVAEWQGGYRTVDGEIQIFADNDAAMQYEQNETSTLWKAILQDGTFVAPGSDNTLKWDYTADPGTTVATKGFRLNTVVEFKQTNSNPYGKAVLNKVKAETGVSVPDILKALTLMPDNSSNYSSDCLYMQNLGERIAMRGGSFSQGHDAGVFNTNGMYPRSLSIHWAGFRPAFIPGI